MIDYCFHKDDSTITLYNKLVKRIALSSLEGINGFFFLFFYKFLLQKIKNPFLIQKKKKGTIFMYG